MTEAKRYHRSDGVRAARGAGFTLLELMVSLTVGGLAIASIYAVGAASTRTFQQQQQIATAQTALRMALNQVKRDIARAGYLGTPNVTVPPGCAPQVCGPINALIDNPAGSGRLAAFSAFQNNIVLVAGTNDGVDPTGLNRANGFTTDDVVLFANYETAANYPVFVINPGNPSQIGISQDWYSFRHDFTDWYNNAAPAYNATAFNDAFRVGRLIGIQTARRVSHFAAITQVDAPGTPTGPVPVTFGAAVPASCVGDLDNAWAAPISAIRYYARNAAAVEADTRTGAPIAQLIRQEVLPTDKVTPLGNNGGVNNPGRAILDYLVAFNLSFTMTTATGCGNPDNYAIGTTTADPNTTENPVTVNGNPERIRAVAIELAVRASQPDPSLLWTQGGCSQLRCFGLPQQPNAVRVRRMRAEVFVPNVAMEGY